ncbi:MAG: class I SAM-dependent methyltransferase [bacterium]|nr:class I SAM-dependent methyltransferase [bacterium]
MRCFICSSENPDYLFSTKDYITGDTFSIFKCSKCGNSFTDPKPEDIEKYYSKNYYGKRKSFAENLINYSRLQKINSLFGSNTRPLPLILDVGCGNGSFLSLLSKRGWPVCGTEVAPENNFACEELNSKVFNKDLIKCELEDKKFDIITMWHTFEHFSEPVDYLLEAGRILKDEGVLIIEVPNFKSWQARLTRGNWFHLDAPRHLAHYNPEGVSFLLNSTGFEAFKISHISFIYSLFGFIQSIINIFTKRNNLLFDLINKKIKITRINIKDIIITSFLIIPVSCVSIFAVFLESIYKRGGIVIIYARKKEQN